MSCPEQITPRYCPGAIVVPSGNCHLRGRAELSESPQPERSIVEDVVFVISIQSLPTVFDAAAISEMRTPESFAASVCASSCAALAAVFAMPGVGAIAIFQTLPSFEYA